jgi:hypothetical protein
MKVRASSSSAVGACRLVLLDHLRRGDVVDLLKESTFVGRDEDCDIVLGDTRVSRRHALISRIDGRTYLEDLRSTFGTTWNGAPCTARTELHDGDVIKFASVETRYEASDSLVSASGVEQQDSAELATQAVPVHSRLQRPVHYEVERQDAGTINNVGRDMHVLMQQRESFVRDIAATRTRARYAIWIGAALMIAGMATVGYGWYQYANRFTSNGSEASFQSAFRSYAHFFVLGGALDLVGTVALVSGIVLHIVATSRRRRLSTDPQFAGLPRLYGTP